MLGLSRHEWGAYHLWAAYLLLALVFVHLALNFAFIKNVIAAKRMWIVALFGLLGTAIFSVFLLWPIGQSGEDSPGQGLRTRSGLGHQGATRMADSACPRRSLLIKGQGVSVAVRKAAVLLETSKLSRFLFQSLFSYSMFSI